MPMVGQKSMPIYKPAKEALREATIDCENLEAHKLADLHCLVDDDCMMSRDEWA